MNNYKTEFLLSRASRDLFYSQKNAEEEVNTPVGDGIVHINVLLNDGQQEIKGGPIIDPSSR